MTDSVRDGCDIRENREARLSSGCGQGGMVGAGTAVCAASAADEEEAEARLDLALARAGMALASDEAAAVRTRIVRSVAQTRALRRVPVANADEPEIVFVPFRGDDQGPR